MHAFVYHLQLYEAEDKSQVNVLLKNEDFSFAYDYGFNSPITFAPQIGYHHRSVVPFFHLQHSCRIVEHGLYSTVNYLLCHILTSYVLMSLTTSLKVVQKPLSNYC